jgi:flagellar basal-body rod protein FlgB
MFTNLNVFRLAHAMASHAGQRQAVIARNVANADTPGYRARDITPFAGAEVQPAGTFSMRADRPTHLNGATSPAWAEVAADGDAAPDGNTVSVEIEMMKAVEARRQHDRAITIYKSALGVLRTGLGRG